MFKCVFCGLHSPSDKARYCSECGPEGPSKNWQSEEIDRPEKVAQYASALSEYYFDAKDDASVAKFSLLRRERLKISHDTHKNLVSRLAVQKNAIAHLTNFRLEFNENVTDAYAGHDTFLSFRYTNLSEDYLFKVSLVGSNPESPDSIVVKAQTKGSVKPLTSATLGFSAIYERMGFKEMSDLQISVTDEFGESANFRVSPFNFKVGNHDQRVTQNISTHNQISIEGRGVIDASGMGKAANASVPDASNEPRWSELGFVYVPPNQPQFEPVAKESPAKPPLEKKESIETFTPQKDDFEASDLSSIRAAAERGIPAAQYKLGEIYRLADGVDLDFELAAHWFQLAADQGNPDAQFKLGLLYEQGMGVDLKNGMVDFAQAADLYLKSAQQGNPQAQFNLGMLQLNGCKGVERNHEQVEYWFLKAAEQGNLDAFFGLYTLYDMALNDTRRGQSWLTKGAERGHLLCQSVLARTHLHGISVPKNREQGLYWLHKAAEQGDPIVQWELASIYADETDGQDVEKAFHWYRLSAEQGCDSAQYALARAYHLGTLGLEQSIDEAVFWYKKAALQGNEESESSLRRLKVWDWE